MKNKTVEQALHQMEEIDHILQQDAQENNQEVYDRFMSLVHQKEGLIDHIKHETGKSPQWTPQGYITNG